MTETWTADVAEPDTKNGSDGRKTRVRFGPKPHQTVPHEWAERMLTQLFQTNRKAFGVVLQHAAGVTTDE